MAMKKMIVKILSLFLVFSIVVTPTYALSITGGSHLIKTTKFFKNDGKEFTSNEEVSFKDDFKLRISLKDLTVHNELSGEVIKPNEEYKLLSLSTYLMSKSDADVEWPVTIGSGEGAPMLGKAKYSKSTQEISFIFDEDMNDESIVMNAYLELEVKLDKSACGTNQNVIISLGGEIPDYNITITENKPKPPTLKKEGEYNLADKTFDWKVEIEKGSLEYTQGLKFIDTFSSNQDYIENSLLIDNVPVENQFIEINGQTISYLNSLEDDKDYTITYKTKMNTASLIDDKLVKNDKEVTVKNNAQLIDIEKNKEVSHDAKEIKQNTGINWIEKTSGQKEIKNNAVYVPWTIKVDTNGYEFKNITIKDIIKKGKPVNSTSELSIVDVSIMTNDGTITSIDWSQISTSNSNGPIVNKNDFHWSMNLNEVLGKEILKGVFTINYQTKITGYADYMKYNQDPIQNNVSISFECPEFDGVGPTTIYGTPAISKQAKINEGTLKKEFVSYNKSTHQMTWKITFNENKNDVLDQVSIKDFIKDDDKHKIIEINDLKINDTSNDINTICTIMKSDKSYEINFKDSQLISKNIVTFQVITELTDPDFYESNNDKTKEFKNSATLFLNDIEYSTVSATHKPIIKVLSKEAKGYDYKKHTVKWEVKINQDQMFLKNTVIEDQLIDGLTLVEESLKLSNDVGEVSLSKDSGSVYYTYQNNVLKAYLGDINQTYTLSFETIVDVVDGRFDNKSFNNYNGTISIYNNVILKKDTSQNTEISAKQDVLNKRLEKKGVPIPSEQKVNYQILINQAQIPMEKSNLKDILSPGLSLSLPSIHLYEVSINNDGSFTKGSEMLVDFNSSVLSDNNEYQKPSGSTLLTISVPENNGKAYVLEYYAYVKDFTLDKYTNDIQGEGIIPGDTSTSLAINSNELGVGGGAQSVKSSIVIYTLVDRKDPSKVIPNAEFTLYYKGKIVSVGITDGNGKVTFSGLDEYVEYQLVQTKTPNGYLPEEAVNVTFEAPKKGYGNKKEVTVENIKRPFEICNKSDDGDKIIGSEFELYKATDDLNEVITSDKLAHIFHEDNLIETKVTDSEGKILFDKDLTDGIYMLKQTSVTDIYNISNDYLVVKIENGLVIHLYSYNDKDEKFNNVFINTKKAEEPKPNPNPTPNPDNPEPNPKPIIPAPKPETPIIKPIEPSIPIPPKQPIKTGDDFPLGINILLISSLTVLLALRKRKI